MAREASRYTTGQLGHPMCAELVAAAITRDELDAEVIAIPESQRAAACDGAAG